MLHLTSYAAIDAGTVPPHVGGTLGIHHTF